MVKKLFGLLALLAMTTQCALAANAPDAVRKDLPRGAISLQWRHLTDNGASGAVWLHLWCVPKGHSKEREQMFAEKKSGPVTRADITQGPSIESSPFHLDVWLAATARWRRVNSVPFAQSKDVQEIALRWLDAKRKRGPVLLLHFGFTHWHEWQVLTFPDGWSGRAWAEEFGWGGEGGYNVSQRFDRTDARGQMIVVEEEWRSEEAAGDFPIPKYRRTVYRWNGRQWDDPTSKYFVIGATEKTRAAAQKIRDQKGWGEVLRSDDYPRLRPGYWLWVTERLRSLREANASVTELKKQKIAAYVRRAR